MKLLNFYATIYSILTGGIYVPFGVPMSVLPPHLVLSIKLFFFISKPYGRVSTLPHTTAFLAVERPHP